MRKNTLYQMMGEFMDRNDPTALSANQVQSIVSKLRTIVDEL